MSLKLELDAAYGVQDSCSERMYINNLSAGVPFILVSCLGKSIREK